MKTVLLTFRKRARRDEAQELCRLLARLGTVSELSQRRPWSVRFTWDLSKYSEALPAWFILIWDVKVET